MKQIMLSIKNIFKELNPWVNIKILHTNFKSDILAGVMVAIIALPLALAFGEISGLGPEAGIWSAIVGGVIGGLFGGCIVGVSGPTAPMASQIATFTGVIIGTTSQPDLTSAFSIIFLSGLILVAFSILRISRFINYLPYSVIAGFMCGIGVIIILSQLNGFVGLDSEPNIVKMFNNLNYTIQNINKEALYVSLPSLLIILLWSFFEKRIKFLQNIPAPLVALIFGTGIAYFMNLNIPYIGDKMNSARTSEIFSFYLPDLNRISEFILPALALAGLAILDSLLSCKVADHMIGLRHNSNRETFGQGMANMAAGLLGGISTATATTQTVGNITFGARTPLSTIVKGLTLFAVLSGLGYLVAAIPIACLAAILFKLGIDILDYRILPVLKKLPLLDLLIFIIVLFITVYENLMIAVLIGFIFAVLLSLKEIKLVLKKTYTHKIILLSESNFFSDKYDKKIIDNLSAIILQPKGPLFFGSIESLINSYLSAIKHEVLIIDMIDVDAIDLSGSYALEDLMSGANSRNIKAFVLNIQPEVKIILDRLDFIKNIGQNNYIDSEESIMPTILDQNN